MSACSAVDGIGQIELPPVPTAATEEVPEPIPAENASQTETEHRHITIGFDKTELQAYDPQNQTELILSFSYETPSVHIPGNVAAEDNINEFIALLNESYYTGDAYGLVYDSGCAPGYNNMLTAAEDNYNYIINSAINFSGEEMSFELGNHRAVSVQRCDDEVISLLYYDYVNLGGVHGSYAYRGYNFSAASGDILSLDDISDDSAAMKAYLASYMVERVNGDAELQQRMLGFVDAEGVLSTEEALSALLREGSWYLGDEGMYIFSDLYELGPYAAGIMEFLVPYSALEGYVKPEYIPVTSTESGSFSVVPAETMTESSKEIIDMLRLHEDGQTIYLVAEGAVRNVRLTRVEYFDRFYETEQLWHCSEMNNCVLQLVTLVPEGMPELKISYEDANGKHEFYLSQSGVDGSFILVDGSVEAVG